MSPAQPLRADIEAAAQALPSRFGNGRELRAIEAKLERGEIVERIVTGYFGQANGLGVLTDQRVFFIVEALLERRFHSFPFHTLLTAVTWNMSGTTGWITLTLHDAVVDIQQVSRERGIDFVTRAQELLADAPPA